MPNWLRTTFLASVIFTTVFLTYTHSKVINSSDSMWSIYTAKSIINDGDIQLDEYKEKAHEEKNYGLIKRNGHLYNFFPLGTAFVAVPFVWLFDELPTYIVTSVIGFSDEPEQIDLKNRAESLHLPLERAIASFYVSLAAVLVFLVAWQTVENRTVAILTAFLFAFCTPAWSTASRGLWQHGPSMFLLIFAIYLSRWARRYFACSAAMGSILALAFVVRPTNGIALILFSLPLIHKDKRLLLFYFLGGLVVIAPFVALNWKIFDMIFPPYYNVTRLHIGREVIEAFLANLISPSRGLFIFSPFLVFAVIEIYHRGRRSQLSVDEILIVIVGALYLSTVSFFPHWWGGHCYGPRFTSELSILLCYFIPFVLKKVLPLKVGYACLFGTAVMVSFMMHWKGATDPKTTNWNVVPNDIDRNPSRVWSILDPQFAR